MTDRYDPSLGLIEMLLESTDVGVEGGGTRRLPGFLFDMNVFFERLVTRFLTEYLDGAEVRSQVRLDKLFAYSPSANPRRRSSPVPRPDIEVRTSRGPRIFLDAKYRDLWNTELPREMLSISSRFTRPQRSAAQRRFCTRPQIQARERQSWRCALGRAHDRSR
ncbi:MAG: hypothetical protein IT379_04195 [Deltaproteobacteria bacterium]|nr:hypothetical protein [Deltaproteobacteria bacterium]